MFIFSITEASDSGKSKYELFELACSQKTKWPENKRLDRRFGKAYFRNVLVDPENHFTVTAGLQPGTEGTGSGGELPIDSKVRA